MGQVAAPGLQQSDIEAHRVLFSRKHNILVRWQNIQKFLLFPCMKYMGSVVSPYSLQRGWGCLCQGHIIIWPEWICSSRKPFDSLWTLGAGWEAFLILSKPDYRLHTGRPAHQLLGDSIELYWLPQLSSPAPPPGDLISPRIVSSVLRRSLLQNRHLKKCMLSVRKIYWERNWKR